MRQYEIYRQMLADYFDEPADKAVLRIEELRRASSAVSSKSPAKCACAQISTQTRQVFAHVRQCSLTYGYAFYQPKWCLNEYPRTRSNILGVKWSEAQFLSAVCCRVFSLPAPKSRASGADP